VEKSSARRPIDASTKNLESSDENDDDDEDDEDDDDDAVANPLTIIATPGYESRLSLYHDSEGNLTTTATSIASAFVGNALLQLRQEGLEARDRLGANQAETRTLSAYDGISEHLALGGGLGVVRTRTWSGFAGSLTAAETFGDAALVLNASHGLLGGTAQAVRDQVMQTEFGFNFSDDFTANTSAELSMKHQMYSDGNSANILVFNPEYELALNQSRLDLAYELAYQAFARNVDHGYFNPRRLLSNGLASTWKFDRSAYYGNVETSAGYATSAGSSGKDGASRSGVCGSISTTLGIRPRDNAAVETFLSGEWSAGWSSTAMGLHLQYTF
jgi:hypothetical protein